MFLKRSHEEGRERKKAETEVKYTKTVDCYSANPPTQYFFPKKRTPKKVL